MQGYIGCTRVYRGIHRYKRVNKGRQEYRGVYKGIQGIFKVSFLGIDLALEIWLFTKLYLYPRFVK